MTRFPGWMVLACVAAAAAVAAPGARHPVASFQTGDGAMAVVTASADDACREGEAPRVSALGVWVDGRYDHEVLLFPGSGRSRYDTLAGPLSRGRHSVELRPSAFWTPASCVETPAVTTTPVAAGDARYLALAHAPVVELRADTVGEQTDVPLYEYVEDLAPGGERVLRYTVVFSNEDGGTQTRALVARWGRTADIEQVLEIALRDGRAVREEFQGPDHETLPFKGRRLGAAPVLLVATLNNMVTDRGRGIARVRPVPEPADLAHATRESTLDTRPWASRVMQAEMAAEGRIAHVPSGDPRWARVAADPREYVYFEAKLTLSAGAVAAAWTRDASGARSWSHYGLASFAVNRDGWVRIGVPVGPNPSSSVAEAGWTCSKATGDGPAGTCVVEATRAFALGIDWTPGVNLVEPKRMELRTGEEGSLTVAKRATD
jgi:hypothetical protein